MEEFAGVIAVNLLRGGRKRSQIDSVSDLQHVKVIIADVHAQKVRHAGPVARCRSHPDNIVIAPLEIHIMVIHQKIHDFIRVRASVKDVADNVQFVHRKAADCLRELHDIFFRYAAFYNRTDNLAVVMRLVFLIVSVQKLVDAVIHVLRQTRPHGCISWIPICKL